MWAEELIVRCCHRLSVEGRQIRVGVKLAAVDGKASDDVGCIRHSRFSKVSDACPAIVMVSATAVVLLFSICIFCHCSYRVLVPCRLELFVFITHIEVSRRCVGGVGLPRAAAK